MLYWRLAIAKASLQSFAAALGVFIGGLSGIKRWEEIEQMQQITLIGSSIGAALLVINAFMDTTMAKLRKDHPNNPDNPENQK